MHRSGVVALALVLVTAFADADVGSSKPRKLHRLWAGLSFGLTTVQHPSSGSDVCAESAWVCAQSDGPLYPNGGTSSLAPPARVGGGFGGLAGSVAVGTFDFALSDGFLLGVRYGYYFHPANVNVVDFGTYFSIFEARATWVLGSHPLTVPGIRPYALLGLGYADFSAPVDTGVTTKDVVGTHTISAWKIAGPGFVTTGIGVRIGNERVAIMIAPVKIAAAFGSGSAIAYMPEIVLLGSPF